MKINKKTILLVSAAVATIVGVAFLIKKPKTDSSPPETTPEPLITTNNLNSDLKLTVGSKGEEVKNLQSRLGGLKIDGVFGPLTLAQLIKKLGVTTITLNDFDDYSNKKGYVESIRNATGKLRDWKTMYEYDLAFLKQWAEGVSKKASEFSYGLFSYSTNTGTKINNQVQNTQNTF